MHKASRKMLLGIYMLVVSLLSLRAAYAPTLHLIINADEQYNLGTDVTVNGTLALDGSPVSDGLVAVQINDPRGDSPEHLFVVRAVTTGSTPPSPQVEILDLFPCNSYGDPKYSFRKGDQLGFKAILYNYFSSQKYVILTLTIYDSSGVPAVIVMWTDNIPPGQSFPIMFYPMYTIPEDAPTGIAPVYGVALTNWPQYNGIAYCPEKSTSFTVTSRGGGLGTSSGTSQSPEPGTFEVPFRPSDDGGVLGEYTIHATSVYNEIYLASNFTTFTVVLITDLTGGPGGGPDGLVDLRDLFYVILRFLTSDPIADVTKDGIVDLRDIFAVILDYGKWGILP